MDSCDKFPKNQLPKGQPKIKGRGGGVGGGLDPKTVWNPIADPDPCCHIYKGLFHSSLLVGAWKEFELVRIRAQSSYYHYARGLHKMIFTTKISDLRLPISKKEPISEKASPTMKILWWECRFLVLSESHLDNALKVIIPDTWELKNNIWFHA